MLRPSKSALAVAATIVAAALLTLMNPKTVHAVVAAALVQVTNTASNPVVNSDATRSPAQIVAIFCTAASCNGVEPGGSTDFRSYVVPSGQTLVITDIEVQAPVFDEGGSAPSGFLIQSLGVPSESLARPYTLTYWVPNDGVTHHFALERGVVWPSGGVLIPLGPPTLSATLRGYLTAD